MQTPLITIGNPFPDRHRRAHTSYAVGFRFPVCQRRTSHSCHTGCEGETGK